MSGGVAEISFRVEDDNGRVLARGTIDAMADSEGVWAAQARCTRQAIASGIATVLAWDPLVVEGFSPTKACSIRLSRPYRVQAGDMVNIEWASPMIQFSQSEKRRPA